MLILKVFIVFENVYVTLEHFNFQLLTLNLFSGRWLIIAKLKQSCISEWNKIIKADSDCFSSFFCLRDTTNQSNFSKLFFK